MLFNRDYRILECLSETGGYPTGDIAFLVHGQRSRSISASMSRELRSLKDKGMVAEMDDQKPVCWVLTPYGRLAVTRRNNGAAPSALVKTQQKETAA